MSSMKRNCEISHECQQKVKKIKHDDRTTEFKNHTVAVKQQLHTLKDICGEIKLMGTPYYGLVLDTQSEVLPLTPIDSAKHLVEWISVIGQSVVVNQLLEISENFQILKKNHSIEHKSYMARWENVRPLYKNGILCKHKVESNEVTDTSKNIHIMGAEESKKIIESDRSCLIVVHHVSPPFHIDDKASGTCLAFISYSNKNSIVSKLWLVLRAEQVAWRELLIANREYYLHFPPGTNGFFFDKAKSLDTIMEKNIRELRVIFHHKILFSKFGELKGSIVPEGSRLFLSWNANVSRFVYEYQADSLWFKFWFSTSEADHASTPLVTFYGKVSSIMYLEEDVYKSCYLCIQRKPKEPEIDKPKNTFSQDWTDPFKTGLVIEENELIELPNVIDNGNNRMKTGVPGELVQVIKLQDLMSGEERCVYIKHSYVSSCQQLARLTPGVVVCLSHLNRRCSSNGKYYYITTLLTCCRVLDCAADGAESEGWGVYGLCHSSGAPQLKTWGVLEPFNITKVAIRAKCTYCQALFFQGRCINFCAGLGTSTTSAYAIAWINIVHDSKTITMEKVIIKDGCVQKLLSIPEEMWALLEDAAKQEEIVAFKDQALLESTASTPLRKMFQVYFNLKKREKFYISVKRLPPNQEDDNLYYCVHLEPINQSRLNTVAELIARTTQHDSTAM